MWPFTRKPTNRRLGRRPVLDVKLRSNVVRAARLRWGAMAAGVLFGTLFGLLALWRAGEWAVSHFLTGNDAFAIRQIDVATDGAIAADQIRRWANVAVGKNLLALDLSRVKRDLELEPFIKMAAVERVLPHSLRIRIVEREPLAQILAPQPQAKGGYQMTALYLDEEGFVMPPLEPRQRATPPAQPPRIFPVITGLDFGPIAPGRRLDPPQLAAALRLILAFERSPMVGMDDLRQIDVSAPGILVAHTAAGSDVTFSTRDFDRQLRRWRQIADTGQRKQRSLATLDLAVSNNVPARWLEAGALPEAVPKAVNPPRSRKKNV